MSFFNHNVSYRQIDALNNFSSLSRSHKYFGNYDLQNFLIMQCGTKVFLQLQRKQWEDGRANTTCYYKLENSSIKIIIINVCA